MHKALFKRFLIVFSIHIYSEERFPHKPGTLYKHFVTVHFFGFRIFHTFWKTGQNYTDEVNQGSFYVKGQYYNDHPIPKHKTESWTTKLERFITGL